MKNRLFLLVLTALCMTLMFMPQSFAQNFVDGQMPDTFLKHGEAVRDIKFSPDGKTLASGSDDNTIKLWDVATGKLKNTLEGHTNWVNSVAFSPDGTTIASGSDDDTVKLWDVATSTLKNTLEGHTNCVNSVAFSPDGATLASGSDDSTVKLWNVASSTLKDTLKQQPDRSGMAKYADYLRIYYDVEIFIGYFINSVAFSPDGTTIASSGRERIKIRFENLDSHSEKNDVINTLLAIQINNHDNQHLRVSPTSERHNPFEGDWDLEAYEHIIDLWDVSSGTLKATLEGPEGVVDSVIFSPNGRILANGSWDRTVRLWDVTRQSKVPKATLSDHGDGVNSVAFSPDGTRLANGSSDGAVRLWTALPPANRDGVVNIADLIEVAQNFGQIGQNNADINGDGVVNIVDLILVAVALGEVAGAPAAQAQAFSMLTAEEVEQWLIEAQQLHTEDPTYLRGILFLEQLLAMLTPQKTVLLPNYPNPFNPETWIPYQLAEPAEVSISIYTVDGRLVRTLELGHRSVGLYESRNRAAYWDGKNTQGEPVASGVYFYAFTAGDFSATRKMLIRK